MKTCNDLNIRLCAGCNKYDTNNMAEFCTLIYYSILMNGRSLENIKNYIIENKDYWNSNISNDGFYLQKAIEISHPEYIDILNKIMILL